MVELLASALPIPATTFLGRGSELAAGEALLAESRFVTVTGPGGVGKTRFALELVRRVETRSGAGTHACFFAPLRDPGLVLATVARTLELADDGRRGALEVVADRLGEDEALLLLDNLEHLPQAAGELAELVAACRGLRIVCTSRERLRVPGERVYELPPLREGEGVALFCERARVEASDTIARLCERLEGIPLAIELAAARLKLLSPSQLLERLSKRLDLLKAGRDADPRQQTLRATIEWSYGLLTPEEQSLFRALSVFSGGCTVESAREVCDGERAELDSLVEKSLLRRSGDRYSMLETIREYAAERLDGTGAGDALRQRRTSYFLDLVERAQPEIVGPAQQEWMELLGAELPNFRSVLGHVESSGDGAAFAALAGGLWRVWHRLGSLAEGREWIERSLEGTDESLEPRIRARAEGGAGYIAMDQGDLVAARRHMEVSLALARAVADPAAIANALNNIALVAGREGKVEEAERLHRESLAIRREVGDPGRIAASLNNLGFMAIDRGDLEQAEALLTEAVALFGEAGDLRGVAVSRGNLADVAYARGDLGAAVAGNRECIAIYQALGERRGIALCSHALSQIAARVGDDPRAARLAGVVDRLREETAMEAPEDDGALQAARERLGEEAWSAAWQEGRALGLDDAIGCALEEFRASGR